MQQPVFIGLYNTLTEALSYRNSPVMEIAFLDFTGVQLLPNQIYPYIQRTYAYNGLEIEAGFVVEVISICGEILSDISDSFEVVRVFQDPDTGFNQIEWRLINVPFDAGQRLIYLRISQGVEFVYSTPFYLTDIRADYTARIDYRDDKDDAMYSTQFCMWYSQSDSLVTLDTYDPLNSGGRYNLMRTTDYEVWKSNVIEVNNLEKLKKVFKNKYVYVDLERTTLFEPFETPRLEASENFGEAEILLCRDNNQKYDPLYIKPIPPDPPPPVYSIDLSVAYSTSPNKVTYIFTLNGFTADELLYETSEDNGLTWLPVLYPNGTSPYDVTVYNLETVDYLFRITDPNLNVVSNTATLPPRSIQLINITGNGSFSTRGNKYDATWIRIGFTPTSSIGIEGSFDDGATWVAMSHGTDNPSPKSFSTPSSGLEFTLFRMRYNPLGIISNTFEFQL